MCVCVRAFQLYITLSCSVPTVGILTVGDRGETVDADEFVKFRDGEIE